MTMMEKQQEKLQVCENNWVRRIAGEKRIEKRRNELREEVGMRESFTRKLRSSGLDTWNEWKGNG